ncbi:hypothetical protein AYO20_11248 [Fonsecaea nubica]|uniref:Uncharacterized protein n=1 Tax=Fonsecaea nubica TaxID=856822 RepID=A0A178BWY4_9EURO|nr:hypothetical protein AYO20_11248 [Fonsecaea nubica]OAL22148.1 hypothetical protein AYO20_11248 [Fonsecaea nubica]
MLGFLEGKATPSWGVDSPSVNLEYVNRKLEAFVRDPSQCRRILVIKSPRTPKTPPYPDPMVPSTFYRTWAEHKAREMQYLEPKIDHRSSIDDLDYWRTEARCYMSLLGDLADLERQNIDEWTYWRTEATFWKETCCTDQRTADRWHVENIQYWKTEVLHLAKVFKNNPQTPNIREHIYDANYWKTETFHYDDLLQRRHNQTLEDQVPKSTLQQNPNCKKRKHEDDGVRRPVNSWLAKWHAAHGKPSGDNVSSEVSAACLKKRRMANAG